MNDVQIEFCRTKGDILNGIAGNVLHSPGVLVRYGVGASFVAGVAMFVTRDSGLATVASAGGGAFVAMLLVYATVLTASIFLAAQKTWNSAGGLDPITLIFTEQGLRAKASVAEGSSSWILWKAAFETRSLIVIRNHLNLIQIIPKRGIDAKALIAIRAMLAAHIPNARLRA